MISQELLSKIITVDCYEIGISRNMLKYQLVEGCRTEINIYELIHKCKEWAISKDYSLLSGFDKETNMPTCFINLGYGITECNMDVWWDEEFTASTEEEAIIMACEYILKMIDKKLLSEVLEWQWEEKYDGSSMVGYSDAWRNFQKLSDEYFTEEEANKKFYHRECQMRSIKETERIRK
jgi:hypothetical protein